VFPFGTQRCGTTLGLVKLLDVLELKLKNATARCLLSRM